MERLFFGTVMIAILLMVGYLLGSLLLAVGVGRWTGKIIMTVGMAVATVACSMLIARVASKAPRE